MADIMSSEQRSNVMRSVRTRNTAPELRVRRILHQLGFRYRLHVRDLPGCPDIVLPRHRTIVFVHGCFWHGHHCPKGRLPASNAQRWRTKISGNQVRDTRRQCELVQMGWKVLTVWECQTNDADAILTSLQSLINRGIS